jgi:hypothetical protein
MKNDRRYHQRSAGLDHQRTIQQLSVWTLHLFPNREATIINSNDSTSEQSEPLKWQEAANQSDLLRHQVA